MNIFEEGINAIKNQNDNYAGFNVSDADDDDPLLLLTDFLLNEYKSKLTQLAYKDSDTFETCGATFEYKGTVFEITQSIQNDDEYREVYFPEDFINKPIKL